MRKANITGLVILNIIAIGWYVWFHLPAMDRMDSLYQNIGNQNQTLANQRQTLVYFASALKHDKWADLSRSRGKTYLSSTGEVEALYRLLDSLCSQPGFDLGEITPSLEEMINYQREWQAGRHNASVPIRIKLKGQYQELADLIGTIEGHPYFDHWLTTNLAGSEKLYPNCQLQIAFVAKMGQPQEVASRE